MPSWYNRLYIVYPTEMSAAHCLLASQKRYILQVYGKLDRGGNHIAPRFGNASSMYH